MMMMMTTTTMMMIMIINIFMLWNFVSYPKCPYRLWAHSASYSIRIGFLSWGLNRPGRDVDHLAARSAEDKNEWSYTPVLPVCLHGQEQPYIFILFVFYTTRWFKYDRDYLCVNKSQFVLVIFEPPCNMTGLDNIMHCSSHANFTAKQHLIRKLHLNSWY